MSTIIMTACWPLQGMNASQKAVLISLADNANDDGVCWPSINYIAERTCLSERAVQNAIKFLQKVGLLAVTDRNGRSNVYTIKPENYKDPRTSCTPAESAPPQKELKPPQNLHPTPAESAEAPANAAPITINNHQGTTNEPSTTGARPSRATDDLILPDWLPKDVWDEWHEFRKTVSGKAWTLSAQRKSLATLKRLQEKGQDPKAVVDQSIERAWTGLFDVKGERFNGQTKAAQSGGFGTKDNHGFDDFRR